MLVIGAYRDHEVDVGHPLRKAIAELDAAGATIERIELAPLGRGEVAAIVADALAEPARRGGRPRRARSTSAPRATRCSCASSCA